MLLLLSWGAFCLSRKLFSQKLFGIKLATFICISIFSFFVLEKVGIDYYFEMKLNSFDLDGDGFFSPEESTPEKERYMDVVIGDANRHIFIIVCFIYSLIWSFVFLIFYKLFLWGRGKFRPSLA
jgi:hypothetical protein